MDVNAMLPQSYIAAHEQVHVVQYDQQFALWAEAADRGLVSLLGPGVASVLGRADLSLGLIPFAPFLDALPRSGNPFELEADHVTARGSR